MLLLLPWDSTAGLRLKARLPCGWKEWQILKKTAPTSRGSSPRILW